MTNFSNKFLILSFCILLFISQSFCQEFPQTNYEITKKILEKFVEKLSGELIKLPDSAFVILGTEHPIFPHLESYLITELTNKGYRFFPTNNPKEFPIIELIIEKYKIVYSKKIETKNRLKRKVEVVITALIKKEDIPVQPVKFETEHNDTISVDFFDYIERDGTPFKAEKPSEEETFVEKYIEPIIVIASSAIAILIFFTVRSK